MALPEIGVRITGNLSGLNAAITSGIGGLNNFNTHATSVSRNITQNVGNINRVNFAGFQRSLQQGQISLSNLQQQAQRTVPAINAVNAAANRSRTDFTNWGRVIQDLPFGFVGIQNNLTQLIPAAGWAGLAFSALISALTFAQTGTDNWTRGLKDNKKAVDGTKKATDEYIDSLDQIGQAQIKGAINAQAEGVELKTLYAISQNTTLSYKTRKEAVDELQNLYPAYFKNIKDEVILNGGAEASYKTLAASIISTARARAKQDEIGKNADRILVLENKIKDSNKERLALERQRNAERAKARSVLDLDLSKDTKLLAIYKQQTADRREWAALEVKNARLASSITKDVRGGADLSGPVGGMDTDGKTGKSLADIYKDLNKAIEKTHVQFGSTFGERNIAQISAYQSAIDSATDAFGRQSDAVKKLQAEQLKLFQLADLKFISSNTGIQNPAFDNKGKSLLKPDLSTRGIPGQVDKDRKKAFDDFNQDVERSLNRFGRRFGETLFTLNEQADQSFEGIFSSLAKELTTALNDVFLGQFTDMLSAMAKKRMADMDEDQKTALSAIGLAGGLISGATKKTNGAGQAIGGALTGGAAGFAVGGPVGAVVGGLVGAIGGIFGAKKAREQEKLQMEQLVEQKKQTKLLERQNALAYTSSIIGRMTTQGIVTGVEVNEFGQLTTKVSGNDLSIVLDRASRSRSRGV